MSDIQYINGLIVKAPNDRAPEYVKAKLSIKRAELIEWLQGQSGDWINADVKVSQGGKWYAQIDNWKPNSEQSERPQRHAPSRQDHNDYIANGTGDKHGEPSFADGPAPGFDSDDIPFKPIPRRQLW